MRLMMSGRAAPLLGCSGCRDFGSLGDREGIDCGLSVHRKSPDPEREDKGGGQLAGRRS